MNDSFLKKFLRLSFMQCLVSHYAYWVQNGLIDFLRYKLSLYRLANFVEYIARTRFVRIEILKSLPVNSNPFHHDHVSMGVQINNDWYALFRGHSMSESITLINIRTGQRYRLPFVKEANDLILKIRRDMVKQYLDEPVMLMSLQLRGSVTVQGSEININQIFSDVVLKEDGSFYLKNNHGYEKKYFINEGWKILTENDLVETSFSNY